jgi:hypothetical protein
VLCFRVGHLFLWQLTVMRRGSHLYSLSFGVRCLQLQLGLGQE